MKPIVFPVNLASEGARDLAKSLDTIRVRPDGKYKYKNNHLIINWGTKSPPKWDKNGIKVLNHWDKIKVSSNKLNCLKLLQQNNISIPPITEDINIAKQWAKDGCIIMCRTKLQSKGGDGIVVARNENEVVHAPLWTVYKKGTEYRLHVFKHGNEFVVFDIQQKKKDSEFDGEISPLIRNKRFGYVFCRENVKCHEKAVQEAIKATAALGLNFAAIDLKFNNYENKAYILEANCGPGLEGQTINNYVNEILLECNS